MSSTAKMAGDFAITQTFALVPVILLTLGGFLIAFSNQK